MSISAQQIIQVSELARIEIEPSQVDSITKKISEIISFVGQLKSLETKNIEPLYNPLDAVQELRSDKITEIDQSEDFLEIAPSVENNLFVVPKVIS